MRRPGFCRFLQAVGLTGPCFSKVSALRLSCCVRFGALRGLCPLLIEALWGFGALLLGCFATVQVLVLLEGQQVGLLLLQLPLELLGLALLLELPPFVLLSAGRVRLNRELWFPHSRCCRCFSGLTAQRPGIFLGSPNIQTYRQFSLIFMREIHTKRCDACVYVLSKVGNLVNGCKDFNVRHLDQSSASDCKTNP